MINILYITITIGTYYYSSNSTDNDDNNKPQVRMVTMALDLPVYHVPSLGIVVHMKPGKITTHTAHTMILEGTCRCSLKPIHWLSYYICGL